MGIVVHLSAALSKDQAPCISGTGPKGSCAPTYSYRALDTPNMLPSLVLPRKEIYK